MIRYIIRKLFYGFLNLFGVVTVIFLLFNILPGDPARMMLDQREDSEQLANIRKKSMVLINQKLSNIAII